MNRARTARAARWLIIAALAVGVFEACSNSSDTAAIPPAGPPDVAITTVDPLTCNDVLLVHLKLTNWTLLPPGICGTQEQCGSVEVTLLDDKGNVLVTQRAATADVQLDLTGQVNPATLSPMQVIKVQLFDDSLKAFVATVGMSSATQDISIAPPSNCSLDGGAGGAAGASGGAAGAPTATGGAAGASGASSVQGGASGAPGVVVEGGSGGEVASAGAPPI